MCPWHGFRRSLLAAIPTALLLNIGSAPAAPGGESARLNTLEIAAMLCLSGDEQALGQSALNGMQLAIDEANARGNKPQIVLKPYDEQTSVEGAKQIANEIVASRATLVLGSEFSFLSLVEGPILAKGGVPALAMATSDLITQNATTFRVILKNSDQGELLATYMSRVLGLHRAAVIAVDDGYGRPLRAGFEDGANRLGLDVTYYSIKTAEEGEQAAHRAAADPTHPAVVLLMLEGIGSRLLPILRREGVTAPVLGGDSFADEVFSGRFGSESEEQYRHGALTNDMYVATPLTLDSASAATLAFARRYRARYGKDPSWHAAAGYDVGLLAVAAAGALANSRETSPTALRAAALSYLLSLDSPARSVPGVLGPIWFDSNRGRTEAGRVARFVDGRLESAPLQIVPVTEASADALQSGAAFELGAGRFGRIQRVVYAGVFMNEISHIDLQRSSFGADFYVWLRFAKNAGADSIDPADINFPNMISGSFNPARPAEQGEMVDGTEYRLWRVQGEFRNDFDLHDFPFDRQRLELPFFNTRGASDRIVYVLDRRTLSGGKLSESPAMNQPSTIASPTAFTELTQWQELGGNERRENLVTDSALGDPRRMGTEGYRELSGFIATFDVKRLALSTVMKTLMPLLLMTLIIYTTLYFPPALIKEKVTVAITGALSGAVLLTAINSQLGSIGYTIAIEYAFFVFFGLTTFTIITALASQHWRNSKRDGLAMATDRATRAVFFLAIAALLAGAWWISASAEAAK